jgi:hypothetical protein
MLRIPHCLANRLIDGGKVVSPTHRPNFTPQKYIYFLIFPVFISCFIPSPIPLSGYDVTHDHTEYDPFHFVTCQAAKGDQLHEIYYASLES